VDEGGVTSAVVVAEIEVVLPEADPGAVGEVLSVVATSVVGVVWEPPLATVEAEDVSTLGDTDPV
jgi:hypothetical protein